MTWKHRTEIDQLFNAILTLQSVEECYAFFEDAWWVSALAYFAGIALIFVGALLINLITGYKAKKSFFASRVFRRRASFAYKAGASQRRKIYSDLCSEV